MTFMMKFLEKYFWILCVAVTLLGLFVPASGVPFRRVALFLMGILFFSGLKLDFAAAVREFKRPFFLIYVCAMFLVVLPLGMWGLAHWVIPGFAVGVLILAAMPAGVVTSSLTDIVRGNAALALVITLVTSLLCPLVAPALIGLATGEMGRGGFVVLANRAGYLAGILFLPLTAAFLVRRAVPGLVARHRDALTGLSILCLMLVILGAMSLTADRCWQIIHQSPARAVKLMAFLFGFSALLHVAGYWVAPWRPPADRAALSITAAYVNNALAIVFVRQFFDHELMLPAILLEIPMTLAILPVRSYLAYVTSRTPSAIGPVIGPSRP